MAKNLSHSELAHRWANRDNCFDSGSSMFSEGSTIYSYGHHFPIARKYVAKGQTVVLFTSRGYSNSTAKHKNFVLGAISHLHTFTVPFVQDNGIGNVNYYVQEIEEAIKMASRARLYKSANLRHAEHLRIEALSYVDFFSIKRLPKKIKLVLNTPVMDPDELQKLTEKEEADRKEYYRIKHANKIKKEEERLVKWLRGEGDARYFWYLEKTYIRFNKESDRIETTKGASVSAKSARIFWEMVKAGKNVHGFSFDETYTISAFNGELKVGCHTIERGELERLAAELGW